MPVLRVDVEVEEVLGNSLIEKVIRKREVHSSCDFNLCDFPLQGRSGSTFPGYSLRAEKEINYCAARRNPCVYLLVSSRIFRTVLDS